MHATIVTASMNKETSMYPLVNYHRYFHDSTIPYSNMTKRKRKVNITIYGIIGNSAKSMQQNFKIAITQLKGKLLLLVVNFSGGKDSSCMRGLLLSTHN